MVGRLIAALSLSVVFLFSSVSFAQIQRTGPNGFVDELTLDRYGMVRRWYTQVPTLRLREKILSLKQDHDVLLAATDKGIIHCLDAETGEIHWSQMISTTQGEVFPPAITKNFVYVCSNTRMAKLDRKSGQILMTLDLPSSVTSGPGSNDDFCYVQCVNNRIYAISMKPDVEEQSKKWPYKRKFTIPRIDWFYDAGSPLDNAPIVLKDRVIFAAASGVVYACHLSQRDLYYRFIPGSKIAAPISFRDRTLYVATVDFNLYAVDVRSGETRWGFPSGYPIHQRPVPIGDDVYLTPEGGGLFDLSDNDGKLRWVNESVTNLIAVSQDRVYGMNRSGRLLILDRTDGSTIGSWLSLDFSVSAYNQTTDRIFLSTPRGLIQCLAEKRNQQPFMHEDPLELSGTVPTLEPADENTTPDAGDDEGSPDDSEPGDDEMMDDREEMDDDSDR